MKDKKQDFENYKLMHYFMYKEPLKGWINEDSFHSMFTMDWGELMAVVEKVEKLEIGDHHSIDVEICRDKCTVKLYFDGCSDPEQEWAGYAEAGEDKIDAVNKALLEFINWYNFVKITQS